MGVKIFCIPQKLHALFLQARGKIKRALIFSLVTIILRHPLVIGRTESFPFPFLSRGNFGEKPFPEFIKAFPDLESDWQNLSCYF
jgi:hypothetical protein